MRFDLVRRSFCSVGSLCNGEVRFVRLVSVVLGMRLGSFRIVVRSVIRLGVY